jgi:hypothetical protein
MSYGDSRYDRRYASGNQIGIGLLIRIIPILIGVCTVGLTMVRGCQQGPFDSGYG